VGGEDTMTTRSFKLRDEGSSGECFCFLECGDVF
jgi:hypothetical protein